MRVPLNGRILQTSHVQRVRSTKSHAALPIGRTARIAYELDTLRAACSKAAGVLLKRGTSDEAELEECAQLDDALAAAQRTLKLAVRNVMLSRLTRNSRARQ
jgi:hypothetical protein